MLLQLSHSSVFGVGAIALLVPFIFLAGFCTYRVFYHPLARYPGPWLAKITNFYAAYHAWKGDIHVDMWRCHEKYGSIVRYGPERLLFNSAQSVQDIYGYSSNVIKAASYNALVHGAPNILTARDKKQHSRRKRIVSQGFSDANLRALEPAVVAQVQRFCGVLCDADGETGISSTKLGTGWGPTRNMSKLSDYLAIDIMSAVIFSSEYNALSNQEHQWVADAISESNVRVGVLYQVPEWKGFWNIDKRLFPRAIEARNRFIKFIGRVLSDRLALPKQEDCRDVFSSLAKAKDETGVGLSVRELGAEASTLIVAGSDTTSTTFAAMFFYLSRRPAVYRRAVAEVRNIFESVDEIRTGPKLNSCVYLRACIDETLRICPPAGSALWREVLPGGTPIDGHFVPAGCDVGVGLFAIHHNAEYFPKPFDFQPERFIATSQAGECAGSAKVAYAPFSVGPRSCIGKGLALSELMLTMATVLFSFDFETADGYGGSEVFEVRDHVTAVKDGPMIRFRPALR